MRFRNIALLLCLLAPILRSTTVHASETPAEHAANIAAAQEMASAPLHGNLPDYSLPPDKLIRAQHISAIRVRAHFLIVAWGILQLVLLLWAGGIAWMRDLAVRAGAGLAAQGKVKTSRWLQGFVFLLLFLLTTALLDLPINIYLHQISVQNGFSIQSWGSYFSDMGKNLGFFFLLGWPLMMLLFLVIRKAPRRWWLALWPVAVALMLFGVYAAPLYYDPHFHKFEPLQKTHPALVEQLEQVAAKGHMNIPPERMFLMQASAKTTTMNAYVTGLGNSKRVVIWDTLLNKATPDQMLVIFGHESGHYVLGHIVIGTASGALGLFLAFYLGYRFVRWTIARFGLRWRIASQDDWGTLAILFLAFSLLTALSEPIDNGISRSIEHAADVYGQEAVHGIVADPQRTGKEAMAVLGENYLEEPNTPRWVEFWTEGHPATGRRAAFAAHYDPWAPSAEPKYFPKQ